MTKLGVNVDHVATVRQARRIAIPDPVEAALLAEAAGAHGITVHLREDRRHIQDRDIRLLRDRVKTHLNLEMAATEEMVAIASDVRPDRATLVPEKRQEITTEGGLSLAAERGAVARAVEAIAREGIPVALFIDPVEETVSRAAAMGAEMIEINTGRYSESRAPDEAAREREVVHAAARYAAGQGLRVHGGHGLNYDNVTAIASIEEIEELNIGHSIVARAIFCGIEQAVREMLELLR